MILENWMLQTDFDAYGPRDLDKDNEPAETYFNEDEVHCFIEYWQRRHHEIPTLPDVMDHFEFSQEHVQEVEKVLGQYDCIYQY